MIPWNSMGPSLSPKTVLMSCTRPMGTGGGWGRVPYLVGVWMLNGSARVYAKNPATNSLRIVSTSAMHPSVSYGIQLNS